MILSIGLLVIPESYVVPFHELHHFNVDGCQFNMLFGVLYAVSLLDQMTQKGSTLSIKNANW